MKRLSAAFCIVGMLFAFAACSNQNPGGIIISQPNRITAEDVARGFYQKQFSIDVNQDLKYDNVPGLETRMVSTLSSEQMVMALSTNGAEANDTASATTAYIIVNFTGGYRNSETTTIENGSMLLTVEGIADSSKFTFSSYTADTTTDLVIRTTMNGRSSVDDVKISLPKSEATGTATVPSAAETEYTFGNDDGVDIKAPEQGSGATITVGTTEVPVDKVSGVAEGNGLFDGGYGTEANPYEIRTAEQFLNIKKMEEKILGGENDNLYFKLTGDIDLRGETGYAATVFSGTLDGDGHTIYGSNGMPFIFKYFYEDTTFKNFTIVFDDENITRLVQWASVRATDQGTGPNRGNTSANNTKVFLYDKPTLTLTMDNVDYRAPSNKFYTVGDNNFAFYVQNNISALDVYYVPDNKFIETWTTSIFTTTEYSIEEPKDYMTYYVNLSNCDISGNFVGGFGNSGAAIFIGGQLLGSQVTIEDCSFDGTLEGYNTALVVGNYANCFNEKTLPKSSITVDNVRGGNIISYSGKGGLAYSNNKAEIPGTVTGNYQQEGTGSALTITAQKGQKITLPANVVVNAASYEVKLSLPTMYWYDSESSDNWTAPTNSNTFTIEYAPGESPVIYVAKVISSIEAEHISDFTEIDWSTVTDRSAEGYLYKFVEYSGQQYLVINYKEAGFIRMYSSIGLPSSTSHCAYPSNVILIAKDANNRIAAVSAPVEI